MKRTLSLKRVLTDATTYQFTDDERFGWALCTVNDATGELLITSDWGNWSHIWGANPHTLGAATLTHFLGRHRASGKLRTDVDYFAMKLLGRKGAYRFSATKTTAYFHKKICERRLETWRGAWGYGRGAQLMTKQIARDLWDEIESLGNELHGCDGADQLYVERFMQLENYAMVSEEPWEEIQTETSPEWTILNETILPALAKACYERIQAPAYQQLHADFLVAREKREADYAASAAAPTT